MKHENMKLYKNFVNTSNDSVPMSTKGMALKAFEEMQNYPANGSGYTLHQVSNSNVVHEALYDMKGLQFVQVDKDERTIQILSSLPRAYQVDLVRHRFKTQGHAYPTCEVIMGILRDLEAEGVFEPI